MQWENLTAPEFARYARETGVCIMTFGVIEKHSDHLPLGTDFLNVHKIACLAAEKEPAMVFPPFYFGQIYEARCHPGTITITPTLLMQLIQSVLDEIGRNGFSKIILVNGHGGNNSLLPFLAQSQLWEQKPYSLYLYTGLTAERETEYASVLETSPHYHACECETSISLANHPELVKMDQVPSQPGISLNRLSHLRSNYTGIWWYGDYPDHYAGDARTASREKGLRLRQIKVDDLAEYIALVKADRAVLALEQEFFERSKNPK